MQESVLPDSEVHKLIIDFLTRSITHDELIILQQWINASTENRKSFNKIKDAWFATDKYSPSQTRVDESWLEYKRKLKPKIFFKRGGHFIVRRVAIYAASWIIFVALGLSAMYLLHDKALTLPSKAVTIRVPLGARSQMELPDGTKVWLNAGTQLTYYQDYGIDGRKLELSGEAYFDVAKDKRHPFVVQTSDIVVQALGTRFNVKAYPDEKTISATLEEGEINVRLINSAHKKEKILLKQNEKIIYFKKVTGNKKYTESAEATMKTEVAAPEGRDLPEMKDVNVLYNIQTELYTSWKDARWIIERETLGNLAPMLERRFNLKILFSDPELKNYKFTGAIENETIDQILNALCLTSPLNYSINKDTIMLKMNENYKEEFGRNITRSN